jgi:hypothetical protein
MRKRQEKWEYIIVRVHMGGDKWEIESRDILNKKGQEGWELASLTNGHGYFKRRIGETGGRNKG